MVISLWIIKHMDNTCVCSVKVNSVKNVIILRLVINVEREVIEIHNGGARKDVQTGNIMQMMGRGS